VSAEDEGQRAKALEAAGLSAAKVALRLVSASLPELSELIAKVRITVDPRVPTAGIFRSGRMLVNPGWLSSLRAADAAFVIAHELMHLALRTHDREGLTDPEIVNWAHDFIINDMLSESLGTPVPAGGLELPGARSMSMEELAIQIQKMRARGRAFQAWDAASALTSGTSASAPLTSGLGAALRKSGLAPPEEKRQTARSSTLRRDVLDATEEQSWFPGEAQDEREAAEAEIREAALRSAGLSVLREGISRAFKDRGAHPGSAHLAVTALRTAYRPPWEEAIQTFLEAMAPTNRTYMRASRRGADRTDVVLPGRKREGFTLHIILDTSGSMQDEFARIAGTIRSFCESVGIKQIHLLQCDTSTTRDEMVDLEQFERLTVRGLGGSDLSDAMRALAADPEVEAAIILTDGYIAYPSEPMPYSVLWAVTSPHFAPPYGRVVPLL
jgi:predicted metal-dependent peptidase